MQTNRINGEATIDLVQGREPVKRIGLHNGGTSNHEMEAAAVEVGYHCLFYPDEKDALEAMQRCGELLESGHRGAHSRIPLRPGSPPVPRQRFRARQHLDQRAHVSRPVIPQASRDAAAPFTAGQQVADDGPVLGVVQLAAHEALEMDRRGVGLAQTGAFNLRFEIASGHGVMVEAVAEFASELT